MGLDWPLLYWSKVGITRCILYIAGVSWNRIPKSEEERMKPSEALASNRAAIRHVVESNRARNARVFGSILRGEDTESSDLDILIDPTPETTMMDVATIQVELHHLLGVSVDVPTPRALPDEFRSVASAEAVKV